MLGIYPLFATAELATPVPVEAIMLSLVDLK